MSRRRKLRGGIVLTAALITGYQLFVPPIVGLADQGDFARTIGRLGFGPENKTDTIAFVTAKYVPDPAFRHQGWEQFTSEYFFVESAILLNKLFSRDGKLDVRVMGLVHLIAFLAAFARLLAVTAQYRSSPLAWIIGLVAFTDVGYVAYWNSFYAEPASSIFVLLLAAESIAICNSAQVSTRQIVLWSLWAILFVMAKAQNAPLGILLLLFSVRLWGWTPQSQIRRWAMFASLAIAAATCLAILTIPDRIKWADAYNHLFLAVLPESKNPSADLQALGLDPQLVKYTGTGSWSPGSGFQELVANGLMESKINHLAIGLFYLHHPARIWRHARMLMPVAFSLRPEWCGNFERSAGLAPGARSSAYNLWSTFHERYLSAAGRSILVLLTLALLLLPAVWIKLPWLRRQIELVGLLGACCLMAFLVAALGDAWDNVKHLYLFNLLLDVYLAFLAAFLAAGVLRLFRGLDDGKRC